MVNLINLTSFSDRGSKYLSHLDEVYGKDPALIANGYKGKEYHKAVRSGWLFAEPLYTLMDVKTPKGKKINIKINHGYGSWSPLGLNVPPKEKDTYVFLSLNDQVLKLVELKKLLSFLKGEETIKSLFNINKDSSYKNEAGYIAKFYGDVCITDVDLYGKKAQKWGEITPYDLYNPEHTYDERWVRMDFLKQVEIKRKIGSLIKSIEGTMFEKFIPIEDEDYYKDMIYDLTEGMLADMIVHEHCWKPVKLGSEASWKIHFFGDKIFPEPNHLETFGVPDNPDVALVSGGAYCCLNHEYDCHFKDGKAAEYSEYALLIKLMEECYKNTPRYLAIFGGIKKAGVKTHRLEIDFLKHIIKFFKRESNKYSENVSETDLFNLSEPEDGLPMNAKYGLLDMSINGNVVKFPYDIDEGYSIVNCYGNVYENNSDVERMNYIVNKHSFSFENFFNKIEEIKPRVIFYLEHVLEILQNEQNSVLISKFSNYFEVVRKTKPLFEYYRRFPIFPYNRIFLFAEKFRKELPEKFEGSIEKYIEHYSKYIGEWYYSGEHSAKKYFDSDLEIKFPHGYDETNGSWLFLRDLDSIPVLVKLISIKKVKIAYKSGNRIDDGILVKYQLKSPIIQGNEEGPIDFLGESETPEMAYVSSSVSGYQHGADRFELCECE